MKVKECIKRIKGTTYTIQAENLCVYCSWNETDEPLCFYNCKVLDTKINFIPYANTIIYISNNSRAYKKFMKRKKEKERQEKEYWENHGGEPTNIIDYIFKTLVYDDLGGK